jgi:trk system potassium uptake protein TrkH
MLEVILSIQLEKVCWDDPNRPFKLTRGRFLDKVHSDLREGTEILMLLEIPIRVKNFYSRYLSPARMFVLSFAGVILTGAILLRFPFSATQGHLRFVNALFTSASAVCVTGLVVVDTGRDLSLMGQVITLFLIQIGGLGIITFSTVFFILMGRGISFKGREIVQSTFLHTPRRDFIVIAKSVLLFTFIAEAGGILFLFIRFSQEFPIGLAFYQATYHAVSAFNNAGFSLFPNSFIGYQGDLIVNLILMSLLIIGGIGFIVQYELFEKLRGAQKKLSVHTKIVLITTSVLIMTGALTAFPFRIRSLPLSFNPSPLGPVASTQWILGF